MSNKWRHEKDVILQRIYEEYPYVWAVTFADLSTEDRDEIVMGVWQKILTWKKNYGGRNDVG